MYLEIKKIKDYLIKNNKFRILFLGDSITSTEWIHPNWREIVEYVVKDEVEKIVDNWKLSFWQIRSINYGMDGANTKDILDKVNEILEYKPDLIITIIGVNDSYSKITVEESISNIKKMLNQFSKSVPYIFWCTSTPFLNGSPENEKYKVYAEETVKIKTDKRIKIFDMFNEYRKYDLSKFFTFKSEENLTIGIKAGQIDPEHPNMLGNAYIAKVFLKEIFGIDFNPELYLKTLISGEKYPRY